MNYLKAILLFITFICYNAYSQSPPSDFKLVGTTGGLSPWAVSETVTLLANGDVHFFRFKGGSQQVLLDTNFTITASQVVQIWQSIQSSNFFSLNSNYQDDSLQDGSFALFTITANSVTKQVKVKNIIQAEIEDLITTINSNVPADFKLNYKRSEKINFVPTDPCDQPFGSVRSFKIKNSHGRYPDKLMTGYESVTSINDVVQTPHGGVEIGYEVSLLGAVIRGFASYKSKGRFFGDGVSITGSYPGNPPPIYTPLKIKLNLEFYGPCANDANVAKIVADILIKWDNKTTSDGKTIQMEVNSLLSPGAATPPGTPGYDDIYIECGKGISFCNDLGTPNSDGTTGGTWYAEEDAGVYAHEAGHLMGLKDQYNAFDKRKDENGNEEWADEQDETVSYSPSDFLNLYRSNYPSLSLSDAKKALAENQRISWPYPDNKDDIMGNFTKSPLQSDIDKLAALAGLIIKINAGDILTNSDFKEQNLVIIHSEDLFLNKGQSKTLNGIYTACIDVNKHGPDSLRVFNAAPSLDKWNGIPAADYLLKFAKYIDTTIYYCGGLNYSGAQYAVWRITDNTPAGVTGDYLLESAGIDLKDQLLYFPKLTSNSSGTSSQADVPQELFAPDIQPKAVNSQIGQNLIYNASISKPDGFNYSTNFSWLLYPPVGSSSQITSNGAFTPDARGIYSVSVKIDITDSVNNTSEYYPELESYAVVPDKFTETFEQANLNKFQWETYGDSQWKITNSDAQTGSYALQSGDVSAGQSTTLAININLPKDTTIAFALKLLSKNFDTVIDFTVDSNYVDSWYFSIDWQFFEYDLKAGEHRLTWILTNYDYDTRSTAYLDNIFFPANSVVTSITQDEQIPLAFSLFQNYPNPFNPSTSIKYGVSSREFVILKIYDILGREIATLVNKEQRPGYYEIKWDAGDQPSGVYLYRIQAGSFIQVRKMLLLK